MPTALITGASSGIGAEYARQLAYGGYDLVLVARRLDRLNTFAEELRAKYDIEAESIQADLIEPDDLTTVADYLREHDIDLLISNAGMAVVGPFSKIALEDHTRVNRLHIDATVTLCHAALEGMRRRKRGAIILVSSFGGFVPMPNSAVYNATKAYMTSFGDALAYEVRKDRINVQVVAPGFTKTDIFSSANVEDAYRENIPGFLWLTAPEVVTESLAALSRAQRIVVPGPLWRVARLLMSIPIFADLLKRYTLSLDE